MSNPKKTALFESHQKLGGKLIDFGGWHLPVQYETIQSEHLACRKDCGLFDVSHMGEVMIKGAHAGDYLDFLVTNYPSQCETFQAQYTVMCLDNGGIVDDLITYKFSDDHYLAVINASNIEKDFSHMKKVEEIFRSRYPQKTDFNLDNQSDQWSQIALQGPKAMSILEKACSKNFNELKPFRMTLENLFGTDQCIIARTGYTGEDGVEIYLPNAYAPNAWESLVEAGSPEGLKPVGLGARDTLRMEMKYPLYGNELDEQTNPLEAGLGWVVKLKKPDFMGKSSIETMKANGVNRKLVGIEMHGKGIPRHDYKLFNEQGSSEIGVITSGTLSPSLEKPIAIGYVSTEFAEIGQKIQIELRNRKIPAEVVRTPFVTKG